jgi:hypothetical protein
VSLTILYRNPQRPDEGGMTMIAGQTEATAMINHLEKRGFEIVKITYAPFTQAVPLPASAGRLSKAESADAAPRGRLVTAVEASD